MFFAGTSLLMMVGQVAVVVNRATRREGLVGIVGQFLEQQLF